MKKQDWEAKERQKVQSWQEWFDRCAQYYQDPRMKMAYYEDGKSVSFAIMQAIYKDIFRKLRANSHHTVLDVGGGVGLFSRAIQNRVKRIINTDISPTMISQAYQRNPRGTFLLCDSKRLPFSSGSFDRILCYSVFHYLSDQAEAKKVMIEFMRVLKKGGKILIGDVLFPPRFLKSLPLGDNSKKRNKNRHWWPSFLDHHLRKFTFPPKFFEKFCQDRGYQCQILRQDIPGKQTASSRYDVILAH